jgi:hypothetical protein
MSIQSDYEAARKAAQAALDKAKTTAEAANAAANKARTIKSLNNDIQKDEAMLGYIKAQLTIYQNRLSDAQKNYTIYFNEIYANGHTPTSAQLEELTSLDNIVKGAQALVNNEIVIQKKVQADYDAKKTKLIALVPSTVKPLVVAVKKKTTPPPGGTGSTGSGDTVQPATKFSADYKYNAPMISGSYFNPSSIQAKELQANGFFVDAGNYSDARDAWSGQSGRGTIQMDKYFLANYDTSQNSKDTVGQFDPQMYGFKFLYNPTTVGMAWGVMAQASPDLEAAGQDKFNPIMAGLASSTVAVSLLLNRIEDMKVLTAKGIKTTASPVGRTDRETEKLLAQAAATFSTDNPYGTAVTATDLVDIYKRGTMYDLEYLFKTVNGPNAVFLSYLNGYTADKGWIRPQVVELHLGQSLRYRGRITDLSVNHAVFDARMVPVLSTVNITFARFPESTLPPAGGATH